jgi:hypothetical protein
MVLPVIPAVQAKAPVLLVTVQPVEPEPPPRRMSPVDMPPMPTVPPPVPSIVRPAVPEMAVPETLRELTALVVRVPPLTLPPLSVPPEMVALLIVDRAVTAPLTSTLNLLTPLFCRSMRLPLGVVVALLAIIRACPATGSLVPLCEMLKAELVPEFCRFRTPAAPVLVLVRPSRLPMKLALLVSLAFLAM